MKAPAIRRSSRSRCRPTGAALHRERGLTMVLVAVAMVAIIAIAALSIDVVTLYLAREEAQRAADAAALAAARVLSVSGITGAVNPSTDTTYWQAICGGSTSSASAAATAVGMESSVGSAAATVAVTYSAGLGTGAATNSDCTNLGSASAAFGVNPMVTVQVTRTSLPTFFSRAWGNTGNTVSATATAEAYNPSNSGNVDNGPTGTITGVRPRCVKPWVVPNQDPLNPPPFHGNYCSPSTTACNTLVGTSDGSITNPGISLNGGVGGSNGVIGETFWLVLDCQHNNPANCQLRGGNTQPQANYNSGATSVKPPPNVLYAPGQVGTPVIAIPSCSEGDPGDAYQQAIDGCDASQNYQCGIPAPGGGNVVDMSRNPDTAGTTTGGVQCLIHQGDSTDTTSSSGQDYFNPFGAPSAYPFQILAGSSNPLSGLSGKAISSSNSIVSLPIYDSNAGVNLISGRSTNDVTFVGFLQVFINAVDQYGNVNVTVLNVAGCSNGSGSEAPTGAGVPGSSPVPIRLITAP
jgi:Flp pilus assembly protein TadG